MKLNIIVLLVVLLIGIVLIVGFAVMDKAPTSSGSVTDNITAFCEKGAVHMWHDDATGETLYELRDTGPADFSATYTFYNAAGEHVGTAEAGDTQAFTLNDGSSAFCSYEGNPCPTYVGEFCSSPN